jgi:hypothetical protein
VWFGWLAGWMAGWLAGPQPRSFFSAFFFYYFGYSNRFSGWAEFRHRTKGESTREKLKRIIRALPMNVAQLITRHQQSAHRRSLDALEPISSRHREINRV